MSACLPPPIGVVELWTAPLRVRGRVLDALMELLAPVEMAEAARFRSAQRRVEFVASRAFQRSVLADYMATSPSCLTFARSAAGKPSLDHNPHDVRFSIANAGQLVLCAVATGREVGVDLEPLRAVPDALDLARRFFAPAEYDALASCRPDQRDAAFLRCWTAKEAYVKARGLGLGLPLDGFLAPVKPGDAFVLRDAITGRALIDWTLRPLDVGREHVGALVVEGPLRRIAHRRPTPT